MIFRLEDDLLVFPPPNLAEKDGLLAVGGDLSVERLILAYRLGIFPWYSEDTPILWYSPHERFVIFPDSVKVSKSMKKVINADVFCITENTSFVKVIKQCA
jgi:leucyl/phenylalanyl-tRNA--protein transferase